MRSPILAGAFLVLSLAVPAAGLASPPPTFVVTDPKGDDYGDGSLRYPLRPDLREGDLDLVEFAAEPSSDGTWFVVRFRRNVRLPGQRVVDYVGTSRDETAKLGFYTLNVDIYVDTDRIEGSGQTSTLPGRKLTIDPKTAWEKVISLSPQPDQAALTARRMLTSEAKAEVRENKPRVDEEDLKLAKKYVRQMLESDFWFVRSTQVLGRRIKFFVPSSFLGGHARPNWAYSVVVTGAVLEPRYDSTKLIGKAGLEDDFLLIPVGTGLSEDHFMGRDMDETQSPAVDVLVPEGQKQEEVLKNYDARTNVFAVLTGVVPKP